MHRAQIVDVLARTEHRACADPQTPALMAGSWPGAKNWQRKSYLRGRRFFSNDAGRRCFRVKRVAKSSCLFHNLANSNLNVLGLEGFLGNLKTNVTTGLFL